MEKKKTYELIILVVIIVLAVISVFSVLQSKEEAVIPKEPKPGEGLGLLDKKNLDDALLSMDAALCDQIEDIVARDRCERLTNPPELSEEEKADKDTLDNALVSGDGSSCSEIADPVMRDRCERFTVSQKPEQTEESTSEEAPLEESEPEVDEQLEIDQSLLNQALTNGDSSLCEQIVDLVIKDRCVRLTG